MPAGLGPAFKIEDGFTDSVVVGYADQVINLMSTSEMGPAPRPRPNSGKNSLSALRGQEAAIGSFDSKEVAKQR